MNSPVVFELLCFEYDDNGGVDKNKTQVVTFRDCPATTTIDIEGDIYTVVFSNGFQFVTPLTEDELEMVIAQALVERINITDEAITALMRKINRDN